METVKVYTPACFDKKAEKEDPQKKQELEAQRIAQLEKEAFQKGYSEGLQKAALEEKVMLEEGRKRIEETCQRLEDIIKRLDNYRRDAVEELLPEIINLSVEIASKIVRKEVELDRNIVSYIAQETLSKVEDTNETVTIKINPIDYDVIVEHLSVLKESSGLKHIVIEPVASIEPGGCLVETDKGEIDARIEEQIKEMADAVSTATNRDL